MPFSTFEQLLARVEQQISVVRAALLSDDPALLESATQNLQQVVTEAFRTYEQLSKSGKSPKHLALRMKELSAALSTVRENLMRKSAFVDQALQIVLPENPQSTYAPKSGPYGSAMRKSGKFGGYSA
jgi:hypothetical protein